MEKKTIAKNNKARYEYFLHKVFEAGIQLTGSEVKSLRNSQASIVESWVKIHNNEAFLIGSTIQQYQYSRDNWSSHNPTRDRKLLLHRKEILELNQALNLERKTIVPVEIFFNPKGIAKISIAIATGKKNWDKRETIRKRDQARHSD